MLNFFGADWWVNGWKSAYRIETGEVFRTYMRHYNQ